MSFRTIINRDGSQWMKGAGPEQDVVIGSRIRLARNIRGIPFPGAASHEDRAKVLEMVKGATALAKNLGQIEFVRLEEVSPLDRRLLVERHLISPQLAARKGAVILRDDEAVSIMVNERDHIRIRSSFGDAADGRLGRCAAASMTSTANNWTLPFPGLGLPDRLP